MSLMSMQTLKNIYVHTYLKDLHFKGIEQNLSIFKNISFQLN